MRITLSCSGAVSRPLHLAERFGGEEMLHALHVPFYARKRPLLAKALGRPLEPQRVAPVLVHDDLLATAARKWAVTTRDPGVAATYAGWQVAFDRRTARRLEAGPDIVVAESMVALETLRRAREFGAVAVLDRTNSHLVYQHRLLAEEYERAGLGPHELFEPAALARGVAEYATADRIVVLSSFAMRSFVEMGVPENKLVLVPSGVDLSTFRPEPKEDDIFRVVFVGLSCVKKGVHLLLEAWDRLALPGAELCLIGAVKEDFRPVMARYEGTYVHRGFVPHAELSRHLSQASVFVLPSIEEGLAKVVMEAMACGVPVVASDHTGAEDVVRDGRDGFVVPAGDVEALAERIERLYRNRGMRMEMGASAVERVASGFTWRDYGDRMIEAYAKILEAHDCRGKDGEGHG